MWALTCAVCAIGCGRIAFDGTGDAARDGVTPTIEWKTTTTSSIPSTGAMGVTIDAPTNCNPGNVLVASIAMGSTGNPQMPIFTPPSGWSLIRRLDSGNDTALVIYWHAATLSEPTTFRWTFDASIEGVAWISCYSGVDSASPIDNEDGVVLSSAGPMYSVPSITTHSANTLLALTFMSHSGLTTWSAPLGATQRANLNNGLSRSGIGADAPFVGPGATDTFTATTSTTQDYALVHVLALRRAP